MKWTIEEGLAFIREHQATANKLNFCLGLGGGVLNNGHSDHDLDVFVMPRMHKGGEDDYYEFFDWVASITSGELHEVEFNDTTWLIRTQIDGKLVDWFVTGQDVAFGEGGYQ